MDTLALPWIKETTATNGTGVITLEGSVSTYLSFSDVVGTETKIWYSIEDSNGNREAGVGSFDGLNLLTRTEVHSVIVNGVFNNINPSPISLSGAAIVNCTFNAESYNQLVTNLKLSFTGVSTGIHYGGKLSINSGDANKVNISAGRGTILDTSVVGSPVVVDVEWPDFDAVTVTNRTNADSSLFAITKEGSILQAATEFSNSEFRSNIVLGGASHPDNTIIADTYSIKVPSNNLASTVRELAKALGALNIEGNVFSANGSNLSINRSAGKIFALGQNFDNDALNPNTVSTVASVGQSFLRLKSDGVGGGEVTGAFNTIDVTNYDLNGTLTPMSTNHWVNIPLYVYPNSGTNLVKYATVEHTTLEEALSALPTEVITRFPILDTALLRGWLTVKKGATNLSDNTQAVFTPKVS